MLAGQDVPVFDCDFGKLGIQICYDMEFDYGWNELARKGAELIAWPTQSPQTSQPAFRAMQNRCYIISSTWRNNASVFEPTGKIPAQLLPPDRTLVHELDLSYAILPWHPDFRREKRCARNTATRWGSDITRTRIAASSGPTIQSFPWPRWPAQSEFPKPNRC